MSDYILWLHEVGMNDVDRVGGKNASLGEMLRNLTADGGVKVPGGFATTAHAYREFLAHEGLAERINETLNALDVDDVATLAATGKQIRQWVMQTPFPLRLIALPYGLLVYRRLLANCNDLNTLYTLHVQKYESSYVFKLLRPRYHKVGQVLTSLRGDALRTYPV